jgi:CheY-like chemotaxis protein
MAGQGGGSPPVLVISDDEELGRLIALSLRRRRLVVEQTDFFLATSPHWLPANGRPVVVVIDVEKPTTDALTFLRVSRQQPWLSGVPIILAADKSAAVIAKLGDGAPMLSTTLDDVGAIVSAALFLVAAASHRAESETADLGHSQR